MNLYEAIKNNITFNEDEDWENSPDWKNKAVINNMPKFKRDIEKILDELYNGGRVIFPNYLEASLSFGSYAEDEEYTIPKQYDILKEKLINCAIKNNFNIDKESFSAEITDGNDFDPEFGYWDVDFTFTPIKSDLNESDNELTFTYEEFKKAFEDKYGKGAYYYGLENPGKLSAKQLYDNFDYDISTGEYENSLEGLMQSIEDECEATGYRTGEIRVPKQKKESEVNKSENNMRNIVFGEGTSMGDTVYVVQTDAPKELLNELLERSNKVYIDGGDYNDIPIWAEEISKKGYTFDFIDEMNAVNYDIDMLDDYDIKEEYIIENQPDLQ